jgi:ubiquinone/menaquinone biosynthesis C-methylase UbiE
MASTFKARTIAAYERSMGRWSRNLATDLIAFGGLEAGEHVLDVGCGTGSLLFALAAENLAAIDGIDFSTGFIDYIKTRTSDPRITVQQGDACALPYANATFDRAFCQLVLHFVSDPALAIAEMRRVVRPGGMVTAATWDHFGGHVVHRIVLDTAAVLDEAAEKHRADLQSGVVSRPGGLGTLFRAAGLMEVTETPIVVRMDFANFDDYWLPIAAGEGRTGRYVEGLSDAARVTLQAHVRRAYLCSNEDGPRSFASVALACRGQVP